MSLKDRNEKEIYREGLYRKIESHLLLDDRPSEYLEIIGETDEFNHFPSDLL